MTEITTVNQNAITAGENRPLDQNPAAVYLATLSESGRRSQKQALNEMARMLGASALLLEGDNPKTGKARRKPDDWTCLNFPWQTLEYQHTAAIRAQLKARYSAATANKFLCALRGVLEESWRLGLMTAEDYHRAADVKSLKVSTLPAGRAAKTNEVYKLLGVCQNDLTPAGARDAAIIGLMVGCGFRRDEIPHLLYENYTVDQETGEGTLKAIGKGDKERELPVVNGAYDALADWLDIRGSEPGPLFYPINKGGKITRRQMTNQAIYNLLQGRIDQAGIKNLSPHDLRRTFITDLLDANADIATVARLAGHADVQTTMRYDRRPEEVKRRAARMLKIPYTRRQKLPGA